MEKCIIFVINGGAGKNIVATAVVSAIKKKYAEHKIIIVTGYEDVWLYNTDIWRVYNFNQISYFYDTYIENKEPIIFSHDPYQSEDYILKRKHLIEVWCNLCGVEYKGEKPSVKFSQLEIKIGEAWASQFNKPLFFLQTNGGAPGQALNISWARDLPLNIAEDIINLYKKDYTILHIRREDQPSLKDTVLHNPSLRDLMITFLFSSKRLLIDSFPQHLSAALNLPSTVCWIANDPKVLGYSIHDNILATGNIIEKSNKFSFLEKYDITGNAKQFPFSNLESVFNSKDVLKSLEKKI